jgi:two-component system cell cycle response regulator DivK
MSRIVVIEDNAQNARMVEKLLRHAGYEVILAEDGEMGLTTVFETKPDLVLIDLGLPDIDGQTVVGLLRQQPEMEKMPIIAFTAWPEDTAHNMALAYGCDGCITKPINTRIFAQQIGTHLQKLVPEFGSASDESAALGQPITDNKPVSNAHLSPKQDDAVS